MMDSIERDWAPEEDCEPRRACRPTVVWTPDRVARLKALAPAHTCTVVSEMLGVSRGSAASHAARLGVSFRRGDRRPSKPRGDAWPADRVETLRRMAPDNSASMIAMSIGVTRNAVIGKAQRLGIKLRGRSEAPGAREAYLARERERKNAANLSRRGPPKPVGRPVGFKAPPRAPKPTAEDIRIAMFDVAPGDAVRLVDVKTHGCRWPFGDPCEDDFRFCGHPATGSSYCAAHHGIVYRPAAAMKAPPMRACR